MSKRVGPHCLQDTNIRPANERSAFPIQLPCEFAAGPNRAGALAVAGPQRARCRQAVPPKLGPDEQCSASAYPHVTESALKLPHISWTTGGWLELQGHGGDLGMWHWRARCSGARRSWAPSELRAGGFFHLEIEPPYPLGPRIYKDSLLAKIRPPFFSRVHHAIQVLVCSCRRLRLGAR